MVFATGVEVGVNVALHVFAAVIVISPFVSQSPVNCENV